MVRITEHIDFDGRVSSRESFAVEGHAGILADLIWG